MRRRTWLYFTGENYNAADISLAHYYIMRIWI